MQETSGTRRALRLREKLRARFRRRVKSAATVALTTALIAAGGVVGLQAADAATGGVGWGTFGGHDVKYAGTFTENGARIVCGQPGALYPTGQLNDAGFWTNYNGVTGDQLAGINRVLTENIDTEDRNTAAALEYAIARTVDPNASHTNWSGQWMPYDDVINYDLYSTAGRDNVSTIQRLANEMVDTINSTTAGSGGTGSGTLDFAVDARNNYNGTVAMHGTPGSTGTITLTNGVFTDTGSNTHDAVEGASYGVRGVAPTEDGTPYKITGTGHFTPPGQEGYAANVHVWTPTVDGQQRSLSPGEKAAPQPFDVAGGDPTNRSTTFQPVLTTTAQAFVQRGEAFTDTVRFSTAADAAGVNNSWYRSSVTSRAVPVTAEGTVYGPYDKPAEQALDAAPTDAPVAGHMSVTTGDSGPDIEYTVTTTEKAPSAGYYYYVWTIDAAKQSDLGRRFLPAGYTFADKFGLSNEQSTVPMKITATTQVPQPEVPLSGVPADVATVDADGYWLKDAAGKNIPVVLRWDAYLDPRESGIEQVAVADKPADVELLGTTTQVITGEGQASTPSADELGFTAPASGEGSIVWVARIVDGDQGQNADRIEEWTDAYGVPTEIQVLAQPKVTTQATTGARKGSEIQDTASVSGTLPANGAELAFEAYHVPMKQDPTTGAWTADVAAADLSKVCTDENRIFTNVGQGQKITATGDYTSPKVTAADYGTIFWIESVWSVPTTPEGKAEQISRGECGIPTETTHVLDVSTRASSVDGSSPVKPGSSVQDTATVIGALPEGATIVFEAYRGDAGNAVCSDATRVWTSEVANLTAGYYSADKPLQPTSGTFVPERVSSQTALWFIETVRDKDGRTLAQGECGVPDETLTLARSELASTGGLPVPITLVGSALLLVAGLAVVALVVIKRRRTAHVNDVS